MESRSCWGGAREYYALEYVHGKGVVFGGIQFASNLLRARRHHGENEFEVMESARVPYFDQALVDTGGDQSLVQSLSTFSGHVERINNNNRSLLTTTTILAHRAVQAGYVFSDSGAVLCGSVGAQNFTRASIHPLRDDISKLRLCEVAAR